MSTPNRSLIRFLALTIILNLAPAALQAGPLAPGSSVAGKTIGEWSAEWWKWGFSFPVATNPLEDASLANQGNVGGPVFFVAASGGTVFDLTINVPSGQYLLFPLLGGVYNYLPPETEADAISFLNANISTVTGLYATLDGVPIPNLFAHDETSPLFTLVVPADGLDVEGTYQARARGYWLMLAPLAPGQHTLSFGGELLAQGFIADTNVTVNVVPEPGTLGLFTLGGVALAGLRSRRRHRPHVTPIRLGPPPAGTGTVTAPANPAIGWSLRTVTANLAPTVRRTVVPGPPVFRPAIRNPRAVFARLGAGVTPASPTPGGVTSSISPASNRHFPLTGNTATGGTNLPCITQESPCASS